MASYDELITQGLTTEDILGTEFTESLTESVTLTDLVKSLTEEIADAITVSDIAAGVTLRLPVAVDSVTLTAVLAANDVVAAIEALTAGDVVDWAGSSFNASASDTLTLRELVVVSWSLVAAETTNISASGVPSAEWVRTIVEQLTASGVAETQLDAVAAASVTVALSELWSSGKGASFSDTVTLTDTITQNAILYASEAETLEVSTALQGAFVISATATESATIADTLLFNQVLQEALSDGITFNVTFGLGGHVYTGWVMNTQNFGVTEYQDYPFNSFTEINGKYYGANENGVYLLEGSDDAGTDIAATVTTGKLAFGDNLSRIVSSYIALRNDGRVLLKTIDDADKEYWYELTASDWTLRGKRVKLGRGIKSRYWQFTLSNADGADFEIDSLVLYPVTLERR